MLADMFTIAAPPAWVFLLLAMGGLAWISVASIKTVVAYVNDPVQPASAFQEIVCRFGHNRVRVVRTQGDLSERVEVLHCRECGDQCSR